jgi:hypothetical protein
MLLKGFCLSLFCVVTSKQTKIMLLLFSEKVLIQTGPIPNKVIRNGGKKLVLLYQN